MAQTRTRDPIETSFLYDEFPDLRSMERNLTVDYDMILKNPFIVGHYQWSTSNFKGDSICKLTFPLDALVNDLIKTPFYRSCFYRGRGRIMLQVMGTPFHQGILLAAAVPPALKTYSLEFMYNTMLNAPHVFLSANDTTSAVLEMPFYCHSKVQRTPGNIAASDPLYSIQGRRNHCCLEVVVMNPLLCPASATSSIELQVSIQYDELDFYVPSNVFSYISQAMSFKSLASVTINNMFSGVKRVFSDALDIGRGLITQYTGLHNGNNSKVENRAYMQLRSPPNTVDTMNTMEKLDPYLDYSRITKDTTFDTRLDEMNINFLTCKPQQIATVTLSTDDPVGTLLLSRPITPQQEVLYYSTNVLTSANHQVLAYMSRYWSGSIYIHIQAAMSKFQRCKLAVFSDYCPEKEQLTSFPSLASVQGLQVVNLEFSEGGQVQTVRMPFNSPTNTLECARDWVTNALQHGIYYIYVASQLSVNDTAVNTVDFNIYYSLGEDFKFYGYGTDEISPYTPNISSFVSQAEDVPSTRDQLDILNKKCVMSDEGIDSETHRPIVSMRDYMRRLQPAYVLSLPTATTTVSQSVIEIPINQIVKIPNLTADRSWNSAIIARRFYFGCDGGYKFKVKMLGVSNMSVSYKPPGTYTSIGSPPLAEATVALNGTSGVGSVRLANEAKLKYTSVSRPSLPIQESANYLQTYASIFNTTRSSAVTDAYGASEAIVDVEVPNLNPYRFTGASDLPFNDTTSHTVDAVNDLGSMIISYKEQQFFTSTGETLSLENFNVLLQIYFAFNDEARCGFQVFGNLLTYQQQVGAIATMHQPTGNRTMNIDPRTDAEYCYYGG